MTPLETVNAFIGALTEKRFDEATFRNQMPAAE